MNTDQVAALVLPLAEAAGLLLYDVEQKGATLRISIDGPEGVPFAALERLSREISLSLDDARERAKADHEKLLEELRGMGVVKGNTSSVCLIS